MDRTKTMCRACGGQVDLLEFESVKVFADRDRLHFCQAGREANPFRRVVFTLPDFLRAVEADFREPEATPDQAIEGVLQDLMSDVRQWMEVVCSNTDTRLLVTGFITDLLMEKAHEHLMGTMEQ